MSTRESSNLPEQVMQDAASGPNTGESHSDDRMARRAALSGFVGSVIEYYDFMVYGTAAALVFGRLFFPSGSAVAGTLAALVTFAVAYVARPVGAVIFGHFGDRVGRQRVLMISLVMMGGSTMVIGLLPTYETIGVAAPIIVVLCRVLQGLSAGAEQTGASLLTMEHSSSRKRAIYSSWTPNGASVGNAIGTMVFIPVSTLPEEALMSWGWRIPFLVSIVTVPIALYIRSTVDESPVFTARGDEAARKSSSGVDHVKRAPIVEVLRGQPKAFFCVFACAFLPSLLSFMAVFGVSFAGRPGAVGSTTVLVAVTASQFVGLLFVPLWAGLAGRVGLKVLFVSGALSCAVGSVAFMAAIASGSVIWTVVIAVLLKGVFYTAAYAIWPVFYARQFTPEVRYTGVGIAMQSSYILVGILPSVCFALVGSGINGWHYAAFLMSGLCLLSGLAAGLSRSAKAALHT